MTTIGFDGKVRRKPSSDTAWFATSFVMTIGYWVACFFLLPSDLVADSLFPVLARSGWVAVVIPAVPFVMTLGLSFLFRVPDRTFWTWVLVIWAAEVVTGLATFLSTFVFIALGR